MCLLTYRAVLENGKAWDKDCECSQYEGVGVKITTYIYKPDRVETLIISLHCRIPAILSMRLSFLSTLKNGFGTVTFLNGEPKPVKIRLDSSLKDVWEEAIKVNFYV